MTRLSALQRHHLRGGVGAAAVVLVEDADRLIAQFGVLDILEQWRTGRLPRKNRWAGYDRRLRHHWTGVALSRRSDAPDRPPGTTYDLDDRFVTDVEGLFCAIGEATNGPGGYFGWNPMALDDRLRGAFCARTPFRLVWHDSAVAHDQRRSGSTVPVEYLMGTFWEHDVEIDLR